MALPTKTHVHDPHGSYPSDCNTPAGTVGPPLPGADALARGIMAYFPEMKFPWGWGSYCRPVRGSKTSLSSHGNGRGIDCYPPVPGGEYGWALAYALEDHHLDLGIQYVIYDGKQIGGSYQWNRKQPFAAWRSYGNKAAGDHSDHLHIEINKTAAAELTFEYVMSVFKGDLPLQPNPTPAAAVAQCAVTGQSPGKSGVWPSLTVTAAGHVVARDDALHHGDLLGLGITPSSPIVDIVSFGPSGYWLAAADGGVFNFGKAPYPAGHAEFYRAFGGKLASPITSAERVLSVSGASILVLHAAGDGGVFNVGGR